MMRLMLTSSPCCVKLNAWKDLADIYHARIFAGPWLIIEKESRFRAKKVQCTMDGYKKVSFLFFPPFLESSRFSPARLMYSTSIPRPNGLGCRRPRRPSTSRSSSTHPGDSTGSSRWKGKRYVITLRISLYRVFQQILTVRCTYNRSLVKYYSKVSI